MTHDLNSNMLVPFSDFLGRHIEQSKCSCWVMLGSVAALGQYLQQQRVLADPLNWSEKVTLQGNVCALLSSKQHAVLHRKQKQNELQKLLLKQQSKEVREEEGESQ